MNSNDSYDKFRAEVKRRASAIKRPVDVSQGVLWLKAVGVEALAGKFPEIKTGRSTDDEFMFSENLVNQLMELAWRQGRAGMTDAEHEREHFAAGYERARREFAKATGLYTEDDMEDSR